MAERIPCTVLGATGVVGQRFVRRLANHPWFEIRHLAASERSTGKTYREAAAWRLDGAPWGGRADQKMVASDPEAAFAPVVFSALDADVARTIEPAFAAKGAWVFTNASAFRMDALVPLLVPEVNAGHLALVEAQRKAKGWRGAIVANPNCTATVLVTALAPLHAAFGVETVLMSSMQAASGAGYPGVPALDILGNVVPYIKSEEGKVEEETAKMLGTLEAGSIRPAAITVSAMCHRVPVLDGHSEAVSVKLRGGPGPAAVREVLAAFRGAPQELGLPSAPKAPIRLHDADDRPQVRLDVEEGGGMTVHVGRVRECRVLGIKFFVVGHNAERGAAGASMLNAELAYARKLL
jgi:aspartate-semialdehyde dehydrogenase